MEAPGVITFKTTTFLVSQYWGYFFSASKNEIGKIIVFHHIDENKTSNPSITIKLLSYYNQWVLVK